MFVQMIELESIGATQTISCRHIYERGCLLVQVMYRAQIYLRYENYRPLIMENKTILTTLPSSVTSQRDFLYCPAYMLFTLQEKVIPRASFKSNLLGINATIVIMFPDCSALKNNSMDRG